MKTEDYIYAAGYVDADGCITTSGTSGFRVTISSTDLTTLQWFQETFGGAINNQYLPSNPKHNIAWKWVLTARGELDDFLAAIVPYMKLKKRQAELVLNYLNRYPSNKCGVRLTPDRKAAFLRVKEEVRRCKTDKHYARH